MFKKEFPSIDDNDWEEMVEFLDQNSSGFISKDEYEFLYEVIKFVSIMPEDPTVKIAKLTGIT